MDSRNPDGLWSDFLTLAGESVYWVSGYVGYALNGCRGVRGEAWLEKVGSDIVRHQGDNGGWSYGPGVPADADSTSWCLLFLSGLKGTTRESLEKALPFLLRHQNRSDGGFRTYASPSQVGRYMGLDQNVSFEGWCSSQLCVTSVAVNALIESGSSAGIGDAMNLIRKSQTADGYWNSYWWSGKLYATVHCMKALKKGGTGDDASLLSKAQDWIAQTQLDDGSWGDSAITGGVPFWTALALRGLMMEPSSDFSERITHGIEWLLTHQMADGSWSPGYILRIPHPSMRGPWKEPSWKRDGKAIGALIRDHKRLFSTATAFTALSEFEEMSRGRIL